MVTGSAAQGLDDWDPTDDTADGATSLDSPVPVVQAHGPHSLSDSDRDDWFSFTLLAGTEYEFFSSGAADTVGFLYRDDAVTLVAKDDEADIFTGVDVNFLIRYTPDASSTFLLRVAMYVPSDSGAYDLNYRQRETEPDPWDPGDDTASGATELDPPFGLETIHGPHTLSDADAADWFSIMLDADIEYEFRGSEGSGTVADLYRADGQTRVAHSDTQSGFRLVFKPVESASYRLRVRPAPGVDETAYTLAYRGGFGIIPTGDDWDYADDIFEGASVMGTPTGAEQTHGPHTLSDVDRNDWFRFTLEEGATYQFESAGNSNVTGALFASDAETLLVPIETFPLEGNFSLTFTPNTTGKYYLHVRELNFSDAEYTLVYHALSDPPTPIVDNWDPIDNVAFGATMLGAPGAEEGVHGPHSLSLDDEFDWFQLALEAGVTYELRTTGNSDTFGEFYASDQTTVLVVQDDGGAGFNFRIRFTPTETDDYLLRVRMFDVGTVGEYFVHFLREELASADGDAWDPIDDIPGGASELGMPTAIDQTHGPHSLSLTDLDDWFRLELRAGFTYEFVTTGDSDTLGALYASDGATLFVERDEGGEGRNFQMVYTPAEDETVLLRVHAFSLETAFYSLRYRGQSPDTAVERWLRMR